MGKAMDKEKESGKARGLLLYLEEKNKKVDEKIASFDTFLDKIKEVLNKYLNVFDTKLSKSIYVEPVLLNVREGRKPMACKTCRPTPTHYRPTAKKLVDKPMDQKKIIMYAGTKGVSGDCRPILLRCPVGCPSPPASPKTSPT